MVGILPFVLKRGRYKQKHPAIIFLNDKEHYQLLEKYLTDFPGIIVGHNIFGFDYKVLKNFIDLRGVISKSVDTLDLLSSKCKGKRVEVVLEQSIQDKFGCVSKKFEGATISGLWNSGKGNEVIDYNIEDCLLTFKLWYHLTTKRPRLVTRMTKNMLKNGRTCDASWRFFLVIFKFLSANRIL